MTDKKINELDEDVKLLTEKYKNFCSILVIAEDNDRNYFTIVGNMCGVCAIKYLYTSCLERNFKHNSELVNENNSNEKVN